MALDLIYDRTAADVERVKTLAAIGWTNMTAAEKDEWLNGSGSATEPLEATDGILTDADDEPIDVLGGTVTVKGAYNYNDLNRVEGAVATLAVEMQDYLDELAAYLAAYDVAPDVLFDLGYTVPTLTTKTDWADADFFVAADAVRYLGNVAALRDLIALDGAPQLPDDMDALTYTEANAIEYMLVIIEAQGAELLAERKALIDLTYPNFIYSNEVFCGEV